MRNKKLNRSMNMIMKENDNQDFFNESGQEIFENLSHDLDISNDIHLRFWIKIISDEVSIFGGIIRISTNLFNIKIGIDSSKTISDLLSTNNDIQNATVKFQVNEWNFCSISLNISENHQKLKIYINSKLQVNIEKFKSLSSVSLVKSKIIIGSSEVFSQTNNWK